MKKNEIHVYGAREHNLKSVDVMVPKDKLVVITGPSGSGKSSLAMDTLYAEGKRRYVESLSSYARQFLGIQRRPDVDKIDGLCPAIAIEQKTVGYNPRSTVGTITEIYDYLRVLYARMGKPHCYKCSTPIQEESPERITLMVLENYTDQMLTLVAPLAVEKKGEFQGELQALFEKGFHRFLIDGTMHRFRDINEIKELKLKKNLKHTIDCVIDKIRINKEEMTRLQEGVEKAFSLTNGVCKIIDPSEKAKTFSSHRMCITCAHSLPELEPRLFSFNSPIGACKKCHGLGQTLQWPWEEGDEEYWKTRYPDHFGHHATIKVCKGCKGMRLNRDALAVLVGKKNIAHLTSMSIEKLLNFFKKLKPPAEKKEVAEPLVREIANRLGFLNDVGLSYLTLGRTARTLSGGEGQRIRLATQIGSALTGVLYILDEPSIGLHQRDNDRLIATLKTLRDQGNTVLVVEHDMDTIEESDYLIDMGPLAGVQGGQVTAFGTPKQVAKNKNSLTGSYLSGKREIALPEHRRKPHHFVSIKGAHLNNLKNIDVDFPLDVLCAVSGVSGSGKSSLVIETLTPAIRQRLKRGNPMITSYDEIEGVPQIENLVVVDQSPIGRTPRSNPATYLGIFDKIRALYASLPESNARGYKVGRFSFNVATGRCFDCNGDGKIKVSMHFLEDVVMVCKTCKGKRYNKQTLQIMYKGKNIADVLNMTVFEATTFFENFPTIAKRLKLLCEVGLDYLKLGQPSTTLSGGEAQRIKLVNELSKRGKGTLYVLDEPTTGLHNIDIEKLLAVLNRLVDRGNSVIVIEHNLDVLKCADWIIDIGPEGGDKGGNVVVAGRPEKVAKKEGSHTGKYLKKVLPA